MLGISPHLTRTQLLHGKATGEWPEHSEWLETLFAKGHAAERAALPLAESLIGDDLYPSVVSLDVDGLPLSASCDGLTIDGSVAFECKLLSSSLQHELENRGIPDHYMAQCQQIMLVTGASRLLFVAHDAAKGANTAVHAWVDPDPGWHKRLVAGWRQFQTDLAVYQPAAPQAAIVQAPVEALPAVRVIVNGALTIDDNLRAFEDALTEFLRDRLITTPQTDQDFADLEGQVKLLKRAEDALRASEQQMLGQISAVDALKRRLDFLADLARSSRLAAEKRVETEKTKRKQGLVVAARQAIVDYALAKSAPYPIDAMRFIDLQTTIKGLKTLTSIGERLNNAVAQAKINIDGVAEDFCNKATWFSKHAEGYEALFPDISTLAHKPLDDFKAAVEVRIEAARRKAEAEQQAKLSAPAPAKAASSIAIDRPSPDAALLRLGQINDRLSPIQLSADGLAALGFEPAQTKQSARLYRASDFPTICERIVAHVNAVARSDDGPAV